MGKKRIRNGRADDPSLSESNKGTALLQVCPTSLAPPAFHTASERRGRGRIKRKQQSTQRLGCVCETEREKKRITFLKGLASGRCTKPRENVTSIALIGARAGWRKNNDVRASALLGKDASEKKRRQIKSSAQKNVHELQSPLSLSMEDRNKHFLLKAP